MVGSCICNWCWWKRWGNRNQGGDGRGWLGKPGIKDRNERERAWLLFLGRQTVGLGTLSLRGDREVIPGIEGFGRRSDGERRGRDQAYRWWAEDSEEPGWRGTGEGRRGRGSSGRGRDQAYQQWADDSLTWGYHYLLPLLTTHCHKYVWTEQYFCSSGKFMFNDFCHNE